MIYAWYVIRIYTSSYIMSSQRYGFQPKLWQAFKAVMRCRWTQTRHQSDSSLHFIVTRLVANPRTQQTRVIVHQTRIIVHQTRVIVHQTRVTVHQTRVLVHQTRIIDPLPKLYWSSHFRGTWFGLCLRKFESYQYLVSPMLFGPGGPHMAAVH